MLQAQLATSTLELINTRIAEHLAEHGLAWLAVGFAGQGLFFLRFLWQWIASEKAGRSKIPVAFWYFSLAGSILLCIYAAFKPTGFDPVFFLAGPLQIVIYLRNLALLKKANQTESDTAPPCQACGKDVVLGGAYCHHCGSRQWVALGAGSGEDRPASGQPVPVTAGVRA